MPDFFYPGENRQVNVNPRQVLLRRGKLGSKLRASTGLDRVSHSHTAHTVPAVRSLSYLKLEEERNGESYPSVSGAEAGNGRIDGLPRTHPSLN